jgi:hypothetical protein
MVASHKGSNGQSITKNTKATSTQQNNNKQGWNLRCDSETHEVLEILGAWMMGKDNMHDELKKSVQIPKTKVIKILALEKLKSLKLLAKDKNSEGANH